MTEEKHNNNSVGIVEAQTVQIPLPDEGLKLRKGGVLHELTVLYETYGVLSPDRDNVVYVCHALTGDAHVAGRNDPSDAKPGWWEEMIGPCKGIDTDYYFVVCANILGGCTGTTGPSSINPETGKQYGSSFPEITVADVVRVQKLLLEQLGIERLAVVIGGSFGGMQVIQWGIQYQDLVDRCICIAAGASLSAQALAFDVVARDAIVSDPNWADGDYYNNDAGPEWGLSHARKIGHITYLSPESLQEKFGRETKGGVDADGQCFQVESYLKYQAEKFIERFDANSYLCITQAMGSFDLIKEFGSLAAAFENVRAKFLIIGLSSDWLFPPEQSTELAAALLRSGKHVSCCTLKAPYGHDAFLIDIQNLSETVKAFLPWVGSDKVSVTNEPGALGKTKFRMIVDAVQPKSRILDLGCGEGDLLSLLLTAKQTVGFGVDIDLNNVIRTIDKGHDVFRGDLDEGLSIIADDSYDYAILSSTLQEVRNPKSVLGEMVRVAREGIIVFPNFGNWRNRVTLGFKGRMPKSDALPHEWYETPNIHLATKADIVDLFDKADLDVLDMVCLPGNNVLDRLFVSLKRCNLGAEYIFTRVASRKSGVGVQNTCRSE